MAARANQSEFKKFFKDDLKTETSEDLEKKLKDVIRKNKAKPDQVAEEVSPQIIKYLCSKVAEHPIHTPKRDAMCEYSPTV